MSDACSIHTNYGNWKPAAVDVVVKVLVEHGGRERALGRMTFDLFTAALLE